MKLFTGWALAAGLALSATAAAAQVPTSRISDFNGPYVDGPYRGRPYYAPPPVEVAPPPLPPRYGYGSGYGSYGPGYAPAPLVPPHEVYNIIREAGLSQLGVPRQRGFIYSIAVIDRSGEDGRLIIDARSGRVLRFVPAWQHGAPYDGAWNSSYGPPGPLAPPAGSARPGVPQVAARSVPVPKPSPLVARQQEPAKSSMDGKPPTEPSTKQASAQVKPVDNSPTTTGSVGNLQNGTTPPILPTQEMPTAQGLE